MRTTNRPIYEIASEISALWRRPYFGAAPYIEAMHSLSTINDTYGLDSAKSILAYFLANASSWRGPDAKRIKNEIRDLLAMK